MDDHAVPEPLDGPPQQSLEKLRTLVAVFGIVFGAVSSIASALELTAVALRTVSAGPVGPWQVFSLRYPAWIISAVASALLLVGSIAWLRKSRHARALLIAYAWLSLTAVVFGMISRVLELISLRFAIGQVAKGVLFVDALGDVLSHTIFPLLILVLLRILPAYSRGFEPIMTVSK